MDPVHADRSTSNAQLTLLDLQDENKRLRDELEKLKHATAVLEIQAPVFVQAELARLFIHDLSHKVLDIEFEGGELIDSVQRELRKFGELGDVLTEQFTAFQNSVGILKKEIIDLRSVVYSYHDEAMLPHTFQASVALKSSLELMRPALDQQMIATQVAEESDALLFGSMPVFQHIILNFIINTIESAKSRTRQRPMTMHFKLGRLNEILKIRIWDTGPGINMQRFRATEDLFKIGSTTKSSGRGVGLAVVRQLLDWHFKASVRLVDPKTALFELTFPQHTGTSK
jgi:nitrogen fixation/metabolism regulation signal transduction histidine kinase